MYSSHYEIVNSQIVDGIKIRVTHQENDLVMTEFTLKKGSILPEHLHLCGHSAYLLEGRITITRNGIVREFVKGDTWSIMKNLIHSTEALEDSVVLEVHSTLNSECHKQLKAETDKLLEV